MLDKARNGTVHRASTALPGEVGPGAFHLSLLGPFSLIGTDGEAIEIGSKKNRLLLAMLASAPGRSMSREALAGALWAEHSEEQARNSLRQALAVLRRELNGLEACLFAAVGSTVALHPDHIALDTGDFLKDVKLGTADALQRAIALWRGPFLADVTASEAGLEHWLTEQREFYNRHYISAMDRLVPLLDGHARIDMALRLVQADNLRETSHLRLMEAYYAAGERSEALRHYDKVRKLLHAELGVEPSPEIEDLRKKITANGHHGDNGQGIPAAPASLSSGPVPPQPAGVQIQAPLEAVPTQQAAPHGKPRSRLTYAAAAILAFVAFAAAGWFFSRQTPGPVTKPSVAILPFESLSGNADDARIAEGLTIDTITDLSRYWNIRVIAKDTTNAYKGKPVDIHQLGTELKVSHVVKGTFQRDRDHVRFTAQLIDAATGAVIWSDRYDRLADEIFAVQSDVANHIANSISSRDGTLEKTTIVSAKRKLPANLGAYEIYLLAQDTMHSGLSDALMIEGQKLLKQAIAMDPTLARAYVKYAWAYAWRITYEGNAGELMKQMVTYARKGTELDPMDADAHAALGYSLTLTGDAVQGEAQFDEALHLNPNAFDLLTIYSCMAHNYGKPERGAESADWAIAVNPNFPNWSIPCLRLGMFMVGRYADAIHI
ncbi:MAG: winged helix-turn-helix domain-containing protein [Rhizobiaceae bacterium]|nr:winged helix-turn-helix domain-containing protein [Rhizobiaceae bacterium]